MYTRFKEFLTVGAFVLTSLVYMSAYLLERATAA